MFQLSLLAVFPWNETQDKMLQTVESWFFKNCIYHKTPENVVVTKMKVYFVLQSLMLVNKFSYIFHTFLCFWANIPNRYCYWKTPFALRFFFLTFLK